MCKNPRIKDNLLAIFLIALSIFFSRSARACTIFYFARDGVVLAGNNEDWRDPATKFWIYPPQQGKHGWIKFGFGSGFPQGGMNDQGLFWDGTSGPHLDMPYSETHKRIFEGPVMQKVIEECSSLADAKKLLQSYYCEDQYKAQYLIGDGMGNSMIAEGDSMVMKQSDFQVLTNFYHSNPGLGGFPCWRYDMATGLLQSCDIITIHYMGTVLASTHQDGKYPTQYSSIYDLVHKTLFLFFYHNYEEYLYLDLQKEMENGPASYDIPSIFSRITVSGPENNDTLTAQSTTIRWNGLPDSQYHIVYGTDPRLSDPVKIKADRSLAHTPLKGSFLCLVPVLFLTWFMHRKQEIAGLGAIILITVILVIQCKKDDQEEEDLHITDHHITLSDLEPHTNYYWKIEAKNIQSGHFTTETVVHSFRVK